MKIKLQPGGKLILTLILLILLYLIISVTGLLGIFSSEYNQIKTNETEKAAIKMPDRPVIIGFVNGSMPENIFLANGGYETTEGSIFHKFGLKAKLTECKNFSDLNELLKTGGDRGGIDIAYLNSYQLVQKYSSLKELGVKCFHLSDTKSETNYLLSDKKYKSIRDLNNKQVSLCDNNSSLFLLSAISKRVKADSILPVFSQSDIESYKKLTAYQAAAAFIKDKSQLENLKFDKNFKVLSEEKNQLTNILAATSSTLGEYYAYLKTVAKCCAIASDSLNSKKGYYENTSFASIKSSSNYLTVKDTEGKTAFEKEISSIASGLSGFIPVAGKIYSSDLLYDNIISELSQIKPVNDTPIQPAIVDTKTSGSTTIQNEVNPGVNQALKPANVQNTHPTSAETIQKKRQYEKPNTKNYPPFEKSVLENYYMINFDPDCINLDSLAKHKLSIVARDIRKSDATEVALIGHADSTGEEAYNLILSKKRATEVMEFLNNNFGIDKNIFKTYGKGSSQPLGKNSDPKWKRLNRRVNINIKNK